MENNPKNKISGALAGMDAETSLLCKILMRTGSTIPQLVGFRVRDVERMDLLGGLASEFRAWIKKRGLLPADYIFLPDSGSTMATRRRTFDLRLEAAGTNGTEIRRASCALMLQEKRYAEVARLFSDAMIRKSLEEGSLRIGKRPKERKQRVPIVRRVQDVQLAP